jgi:carboxymethylenebutenolidase
LLVLAIALLAQCGAMSAETSLVLPTVQAPVKIRIFPAPGNISRPTILILHGSRGIEPFAVAYERYANDLAASGFDAWLFSYYAEADDAIMRGKEPTSPHCAL